MAGPSAATLLLQQLPRHKDSIGVRHGDWHRWRRWADGWRCGTFQGAARARTGFFLTHSSCKVIEWTQTDGTDWDHLEVFFPCPAPPPSRRWQPTNQHRLVSAPKTPPRCTTSRAPTTSPGDPPSFWATRAGTLGRAWAALPRHSLPRPRPTGSASSSGFRATPSTTTISGSGTARSPPSCRM